MHNTKYIEEVLLNVNAVPANELLLVGPYFYYCSTVHQALAV